jgi:hypothetical protein
VTVADNGFPTCFTIDAVDVTVAVSVRRNTRSAAIVAVSVTFPVSGFPTCLTNVAELVTVVAVNDFATCFTTVAVDVTVAVTSFPTWSANSAVVVTVASTPAPSSLPPRPRSAPALEPRTASSGSGSADSTLPPYQHDSPPAPRPPTAFYEAAKPATQPPPAGNHRCRSMGYAAGGSRPRHHTARRVMRRTELGGARPEVHRREVSNRRRRRRRLEPVPSIDTMSMP